MTDQHTEDPAAHTAEGSATAGIAGAAPAPVLRMPASVRAARIITLVFAGLGVLLVVTLLATGKTSMAMRDGLGYLPTILLGALALRFVRGAERIRLYAISVATVQALLGLAVFAKVILPPGPLATIAGVVVVVLLTRASAKQWFADSTSAQSEQARMS
ncbi:hypothetical protein ABZ319_15095 [Nocardia sp. NPDC005978]|uniref:hypothetical protein n=1 Tax=Nocardia sp. NPDC005978 TaxID=3156725 RepID=UPI0033BF5A4A